MLVKVEGDIVTADDKQYTKDEFVEFICKKNIKGACGFDSDELFHHNVILQHTLHISRKNNRYHHRQALGYCNDDNGDH